MKRSESRNAIDCVYLLHCAGRIQVQSVVLPVIKKLSTGEPCLIPHVGAHPRLWKNVSPPTTRVSGVARRGGGKKKKKTRKGWKGREEWRARARALQYASIENHAARGVFFFYMRSAFARRAHCRFLHSKDFLLFFRTSLLKDRSMF